MMQKYNMKKRLSISLSLFFKKIHPTPICEKTIQSYPLPLKELVPVRAEERECD